MSASVAQSLQAERATRSANNPIPGLTIDPSQEGWYIFSTANRAFLTSNQYHKITTTFYGNRNS